MELFLNPLLVNIIGAGNLGKTIGRLITTHKLAKIGGVINTSAQSTQAAIAFIGEGLCCTSMDEIPPADIILIATPDDLIAPTCQQIAEHDVFQAGTIVFHCSGSLSSDALSTAKEKGASIASIHPMRSFAKPELSVTHYEGTYCAMEGDEEAIAVLNPLFASFGSKTYTITKQKKSLYHSAGVFASNYLITLSQQAVLALQEAGVEQDLAMQVITSLMKGTITNLENTLSAQQSLTGPIHRGDLSTIREHMNALTNPVQKELYSLLGKATLLLTTHDKTKTELIENSLMIDEGS